MQDPVFTLGNTLFVDAVSGDYADSMESQNIVVANMCAQTLGGKRPLYYDALVSCLNEVCDWCADRAEKKSVKIIAPAFAGGNWSMITELIEDCWFRSYILVEDVTVFYLPGTLDLSQ